MDGHAASVFGRYIFVSGIIKLVRWYVTLADITSDTLRCMRWRKAAHTAMTKRRQQTATWRLGLLTHVNLRGLL